MRTPSDEQVERFHRDGFLIVEEGFISESTIEVLRERFDRLFAGEYATGIQPDEVNWRAGRDPEDRTRQICNGWRADDVIAAQVLSERTGRLAAQLMGYRGARLLQDNCLWKPPGARSPGMHQDGSYTDYLVPAEMITCWVAPQRGSHAPPRARLPPAAGPRPLSPDPRGPDLLALQAPGRPLHGRVVLPRGLGRERGPHALARRPAGAAHVMRGRVVPGSNSITEGG